MFDVNTIIHYPQGRLGNLLFQLVAASEVIGARNRVVTLASEATDYFNWDDSFFILPCPRCIRARVTLVWMYILRLISQIGIIGIIQPDQLDLPNGFTSEGIGVKINQGFFSNVYVLVGFFQHECFRKVKPETIKSLKSDAEFRLKNIPLEFRVAVHFRFGDYENFSIYGAKGTEIPLHYYIKAFNLIEKKIQMPEYIIFSDNPQKAKLVMNQTGRFFTIYDGNEPIHDFVGMSSCSHAVLSASTFAWWAADLIQNPNKIIIAPEFWLGFKTNSWFPTHIKTKGFTYISAL